MKLIKLVTPVLALGMGWVLLSSDVKAQLPAGGTAHQGAISQAAAAMGVSVAVRNLPPEQVKADSGEVEAENIRTIRNPRVRTENRGGQADEWMDFAVQTIVPEPLMPAAILSFEGNSSADNAAVYGGRVLPPDTHGDVGPNHYVQQTNLLVRIFNKAGVPLTPPFKLSSLFTSGGICNVTDNGDPYVAYDPLADRWLLSQFGFTSTSAPPYHQCIAISQTGDPTGAYFLYDFVTPGSEFPDYPKLGVWPDAYYMTVNQFLGGGPFDGAGAYAFDRKKMLAGDPTATFNYFNLNLASHPEGIAGMLAADLDGLTPPPAGSPDVFAYFLATEFGDALDGLRLFDFHADFANPLNATFTERAESPVSVAAFNPLVSGIPQPGGAPLATLRDRLMTRLQYRNTPSGQSLVVTHTVDADPSAASLAGIRYYELLRTGSSYGVAEQATYAPDATNRWMGSAATDHDGNLAVGFSASSASVFPGIRFAGRLATDPPGGLFQGESVAINGSGVQTHTSGRWGDYSALTLDPADDCTFWYTQEYYTAAGQASSAAGWQTRVATFKFPICSALQRGTINVHVTLCATGGNVANAAVTIGGALYGVTNGAGALTATVAPGTFTVAASAAVGTGSTSVTVGAGGTVAANLCLGTVLTDTDLVETAVSNPPATVAQSGSFSVTDTAQNNGTVPAGASTTRYYLSLDTTKSGGDVLLAGSRAVPVLASGASSSGTVTVTVPGSTAADTYFLLACADDTGAVPESNESNNCIASTTTVQVQSGGGGGPDLVVTAVLNPPASLAVGEAFAITDTTRNQGGASTVVVTNTRYYLSLDTVWNKGDKLLKGARKVPVLAAGASSTGSKNVVVKSTTPPGTYFLLACADDTKKVVEGDEVNNCRASTTQVIVH